MCRYQRYGFAAEAWQVMDMIHLQGCVTTIQCCVHLSIHLRLFMFMFVGYVFYGSIFFFFQNGDVLYSFWLAERFNRKFISLRKSAEVVVIRRCKKQDTQLLRCGAEGEIWFWWLFVLSRTTRQLQIVRWSDEGESNSRPSLHWCR